MAGTQSKPERFMLHSIVPILCSILVGFILFQETVFQRGNPAFQFVWSALVMALFYNLLREVRLRDAYIGFGVLAFLTLMTTNSTRSAYLLRDLFYVAGMGASVVIYARYYVRSAVAATLASAVTFAGLYGMMTIVATSCDVILLKIFTVDPVNVRQIAASSPFGLLIGFAVGAGFDLAERFPRGAQAAGTEETENSGVPAER